MKINNIYMKRFLTKSFKLLFIAIICASFLLLLLFCLFQANLLDSFASVRFDKNKLEYSTSTVPMYDNQNLPIKVLTSEQKNLKFEEINQSTIDAFTSIEDKNFFKHKGINYKRILKAGLVNLSKMKFVQGASTISQQLIKNTHLTSDKTLKRKFDELILTKQLEKNLNKNQIMTAYLNAIYFGNGTFGINQASQRYFSKNANELTLSQGAMLAGIIKSPKTYSPLLNPEKCLQRRNQVLNEMYKCGKISLEECNKAKEESLNLKLNKSFLGYNTYYNAVVDEACKILKVNERDLLLREYEIKTYQNAELQKILINQINDLSDYTSDTDALIMSIDNKSGGINGFYGKSDYNLLTINRQPGSVFKPIISYAPAIENNIISPCTPILDQEIDINGYTPHNYNNKYYGWVSARDALANSLNIPSVKILEYTGIDKAKSFAKRLNIDFDNNDNGYSLALGGLTNGLKIKDVANCYQAFANDGKYINAKFIKSISTKNGKNLYTNLETEKRVMKESTAYLITNMLRESVNSGTSRKLKLKNMDIASKTGTVSCYDKNYNSDCYNISYTPSNTLCIWLGATGEKKLPHNITGSNLPTTISQCIYKSYPLASQKFDTPSSIKSIELNQIEYEKNNKILLATQNTPERYKLKEIFAMDNLPSEYSKMFNQIDNFNLNGEIIEDGIKLSLTANKYLKYQIYCQSEDNIRLLTTISNRQGDYSIIDKNLTTGNFYSYYAVASYLNDDESKIQKQSNIIKFYLEKY